mmetsp:Transcript_12187/g.28764  ORF Transcript_12187/g.28764 Transcript_12187/m.28764 type:complete len:135 (-) Transcript_12187:75-479(-)
MLVKEHSSYNSYERSIAQADADGVEVGTLNHSADFARKFVPSMHEAIIDGIGRLLTMIDPATSRLPAFALVADKATNSRQTGQMVGLVVMICADLIMILIIQILIMVIIIITVKIIIRIILIIIITIKNSTQRR